MPNIQSAIKNVRKSQRKRVINDRYRTKIDAMKKLIRKGGKDLKLEECYSLIGKAIKKNIIPKNKGARLQSTVARAITSRDLKQQEATS